jgi:hypothetical protein
MQAEEALEERKSRACKAYQKLIMHVYADYEQTRKMKPRTKNVKQKERPSRDDEEDPGKSCQSIRLLFSFLSSLRVSYV